ncbi:MAG: purine/pyrimidine permease [Myxococcales bacterium]|nr:purine/pyrimidine permease [Myxococcales bacterium]
MARDPQLIYGIDDRPPRWETVVLGFQHYLTMFGSTVAIPLLLAEHLGIGDDRLALAKLIGTMFFVSGITTLLQTTYGNRLPIVQGGTFSFLAATIAICGMAGLRDAGFEVRITHVQGAVIAGALAQIVIGYSGLVGRLMRFVGPITIAPTIALIGLALFEFGAPVAGTHWGLGGLTIALIILFSQYLRHRSRFFQMFPVLLAITLAWGTAAALTATGTFPPGHPGHVDTSILATSPWVHVPTPFQWGWPVFTASAVVGMLAGYVASMIESIGDYYACARLAGAPPPDPSTVNRGIGMEGVGCLIAGVIGTGNGTTSYSENIGAIALTRVGSRRVVQAGAVLMIGFGAIAKFGALFTTIPQPIVGGMYCAMFGMIAAVGLSNLQLVDLSSPRNLFILGFSFFMGLSVPQYFRAHELALVASYTESVGPPSPWLAALLQVTSDVLGTIGKTGMAVAAILAIFLDNTIPGTLEERGLATPEARA